MIPFYVTQTNKNNARLPPHAPCACFHCSAFTARVDCDRQQPDQPTNWNVGQQSCCGSWCTSQPLCVPPNPKELDIGNSSKNQNPLTQTAYYKSAPNLVGTFNKSMIDTSEQLLKAYSKFGKYSQNAANLNDVANTFCGSTSKVGDKVLSTINNPDADGNNWCTRWFRNLSPSERDIFIQRYCSRNSNASDCKCANRTQDPIYNKTKALHVFNDGCWYLSCSDNMNQLLPSNVLNPTCPGNICQTVFNIIDTGAVTVDDVKNSINCNFDNYKPPKPVTPEPPPPPSPAPKDNSLFLQYKYYIAFGTLLFVFVLYFGLK